MDHVKLSDGFGRHIHKLRVQITDVCNFRCFYCMPLDATFMPKSQLLSTEKLLSVCGHLVACGIDEIRVSGGEPLLRPEFNGIMEGLSRMPLKQLGLTTNGDRLAEKLNFLKSTRCRHINISLDTLNPARFREITRSFSFDRVYQAAILAREKGFHVKANAVIMRGINDDELFDFIGFSKRYDIEVRFLELMKIGCANIHHDRYFIPAGEMIERIEQRYHLTRIPMPADSTSFNFMTDHGARLGFIASESRPFCGSCSRLRLSADGYLRACLMSEQGISLRNEPVGQYPYLLEQVMALKPLYRLEQIEQPMYQIGG